ncbi:MAG: hypothetical protein PHX78_07565 [bacterium]|nr:hypothetical protein [bacterium]
MFQNKLKEFVPLSDTFYKDVNISFEEIVGNLPLFILINGLYENRHEDYLGRNGPKYCEIFSYDFSSGQYILNDRFYNYVRVSADGPTGGSDYIDISNVKFVSTKQKGVKNLVVTTERNGESTYFDFVEFRDKEKIFNNWVKEDLFKWDGKKFLLYKTIEDGKITFDTEKLNELNNLLKVNSKEITVEIINFMANSNGEIAKSTYYKIAERLTLLREIDKKSYKDSIDNLVQLAATGTAEERDVCIKMLYRYYNVKNPPGFEQNQIDILRKTIDEKNLPQYLNNILIRILSHAGDENVLPIALKSLELALDKDTLTAMDVISCIEELAEKGVQFSQDHILVLKKAASSDIPSDIGDVAETIGDVANRILQKIMANEEKRHTLK